jgi:hypothetical protein
MMIRAGFLAAAEEFVERAMSEYSPREFDKIERAWLANPLKYR